MSLSTAKIDYDIAQDAYWLICGDRRLLLPRVLTSPMNGLVDSRPLEKLPDFEKKGIVGDSTTVNKRWLQNHPGDVCK